VISRSGITSIYYDGNAIAEGFEWFIRTSRRRRILQDSSTANVEEPDGSSPASSLTRFGTPKSVKVSECVLQSTFFGNHWKSHCPFII